MTTYGTMQTRIANELDRDDLTAEIKDAILSAIVFYEREPWWFLETQTPPATLQTAANSEFVDLPADYLQGFDDLQITVNDDTYPLQRRTHQYINEISEDDDHTGYPTIYAIYSDKIQLYPIPNGVFPLTPSYPKQLTALSADSDSNAWTTHAEELIRQRAKADVRINVIGEPTTIATQAQLAARDMPYLSTMEKVAYQVLKSVHTRRITTGRLRPTYF